MNAHSEIKQISFDDFKKIDLKRIIYAQLDTGEILMINHDSDKNTINLEFNPKKDKKKKKAYALPKEYFKVNHLFKNARSSEKRSKKLNLIKDWISLNDYNMQQKLKFYDKIPKRAKFWENESFDASKAHFQKKRIKRKIKYNKYKNYYYINNYKPFPKDISINTEFNQNNNFNNIINNFNQANQYMEPNYLYQIALGPLYSLYLNSQQTSNNNNNNPWEQYSQNNNYYHNQNYYNYGQKQTNQYNYYNYGQQQISQNDYYDFQNNYNGYGQLENINSINVENKENAKI